MRKREITRQTIEAYSQWLYQNEKSPATIQKYRHSLELFSQYAKGRPVSKELVLKWKEQLRERMAPGTVNGALAALNGFFRYKHWEDCVVKLIRIRKRVYCLEQKELSREEYTRLVRAAKDAGNERMVMVLQTVCVTGMRISELKFITVESLEKRAAEVECKGKIRTVFLTASLCQALRQYAQTRQITRGALFITRSGRPLDRSNIWREMKQLGHQAGVEPEKVFPHNLRHLFARTYYSQEKDLLRLSDILGHSSINTTRIYTMESGGNHIRQLENMGLMVDMGRENAGTGDMNGNSIDVEPDWIEG